MEDLTSSVRVSLSKSNVEVKIHLTKRHLMLTERRQRHILLRSSSAKSFQKCRKYKKHKSRELQKNSGSCFLSVFCHCILPSLSGQGTSLREYRREDLEVVSLPQKNVNATWSYSVCVFQVVNFPNKCSSGEWTVHVNDTRKCLIRSEQEQLFRWCLDMLIEILHIPEEVPGVQAVKSDLAASSEKETYPNRECQFSNSK